MKVVLASIAVCLSVAANAQQGAGLSRQVEVTKDYVPDVSLATKLSITPRLGDTTSLRPDVDYALTPVPANQHGDVAPISPARVNNVIYDADSRFWAKAGLGYPFNTQFDLYGTNTNSGTSRWGGFVNHKGQYSNVKNDFGDDVSAALIKNKAGLFGKTAFGRDDRFKLEGEGGFSYDYYARYAYMFDSGGTPKQAFSMPYLDFTLGDEFTDLSYWNFRMGGDIYYLTDKFDCAERGVRAFAEIGKSLASNNKVILRLDVEDYEARTDSAQVCAWPNYRNTILRVAPSYEYSDNHLSVKLGAKVVFDNLASSGYDMWIFPDVKVEYDLGSDMLVPFLTATGDVYNNGMRNTMERSPYYDFIMTDFNTVENTRRLNFRAGVRGDIGAYFSYNAYAGYSSYKRQQYMSFFDGTALTNKFAYIAYGEPDDLSYFVLGGDVSWRIVGQFELKAGIRGYSYDSDNYDHPLNMPEFDATLSATYKFTDRISAWVDADVLGKRYFRYVVYSQGTVGVSTAVEYVSIDPVVDLGVGAEYKIDNRWAIYAEGRNLTGNNLYPYPHYPSLGASFTAGLKINF